MRARAVGTRMARGWRGPHWRVRAFAAAILASRRPCLLRTATAPSPCVPSLLPAPLPPRSFRAFFPRLSCFSRWTAWTRRTSQGCCRSRRPAPRPPRPTPLRAAARAWLSWAPAAPSISAACSRGRCMTHSRSPFPGSCRLPAARACAQHDEQLWAASGRGYGSGFVPAVPLGGFLVQWTRVTGRTRAGCLASLCRPQERLRTLSDIGKWKMGMRFALDFYK
jgi:hypothetical protein